MISHLRLYALRIMIVEEQSKTGEARTHNKALSHHTTIRYA